MKYAKAAEKMRQQQLDEPSTFQQSTEADDSNNDLSDANPGEQSIQGGSSLEAPEESYLQATSRNPLPRI